MSVYQPHLSHALAQNNFTLTDTQCQQLERYLLLLEKWNKVYNLTAITDPIEMVYLHIIDSLSIAPFIQGPRIIDIGSGAGLPGIPLAILYPHWQWFLMDKNSKKTRFLTQVTAELGLAHVQVLHARCEDFHPTLLFDCVLSRAYASLKLFYATTHHLLNTQGSLVAMKGKYPTSELQDMPQAGKIITITPIIVHGKKIERHVVTISHQ